MDEKNQYEQAMTKALSYGCIKRQEWLKDKISHEDNIGHLFIVDITFHEKIVDITFHEKSPKTLLLNEIYPPIFEIITKMEPFEKSTLQLVSILQRNEEKETIKSFPYNSKTHSTLKVKSSFLFILKISIF